METDRYNDRAYRVSRASYILQDNVEYFASILVADAFLAKLLKYIGIDDSTVGIISSVTSFANLTQLLALALQKNMRNIKRLVTVFKIISMVLFTGAYFLPLLGLDSKTNLVLTYVTVAGGCFIRFFCSTLHYQWCNSFIPLRRLSRFTSLRESISIILGIILSLGAGMLVDSYEARGDLRTAFIIIGVMMAAFSVIDLVMLLIMKDNQQVFETGKNGAGESFIITLLKNKGYMSALILQTLTQFAISVTIGFLATYKTQELGYGVMALQVISTVGGILRMGLNIPLGKYSDRNSKVSGYLIGLVLTFLSFAAVIFAAPGCRWPMIAHIVLLNISYSGTSVNSANMLLCYVPFSQFSQAISILRVVNGLAGLAATFVGSALMNYIIARGNTFMGVSAYPQQIMSAVTSVMLLLTVFYGLFVVKKQPEVSQYGDDRVR